MNSKYDKRRRAFWISHALLTAFFAILLCVMIAAGQDVRADTAAWIVMLATHLVASALISHVASRERMCKAGDEALAALRAGTPPPPNRGGAEEQQPAYISPANISATCVTLQPTEDGRELGDHGLILSVLAALRSADAIPLPDRGVLKQLVYEMAYRFAADSMEERDRRGILNERKAETRMDAYANHCQGIQELRAAAQQDGGAASKIFSASGFAPLPGAPDFDAYALRVDEFARRVPQPQTEALLQLHKTALAGGMKPIRITDDQQFNPNSPEALDALLDAAGAPDPRDMGDALAYAFVGLDHAKPDSDRTVFAPHSAHENPSALAAWHGALNLFSAERARQVNAEGCKPEHDDGYIHAELARAAACYATPHGMRSCEDGKPLRWPWGAESWKPTPNDRLREVVKAGALLLAEAERLIRAQK